MWAQGNGAGNQAAGRKRVLIISEDLSLPVDEGLKKFVYSVSTPLKDHVDLLVISTQGPGGVGEGVQIIRANRFLLSHELRRTVADYAPHGVIYVPRAAGTRNAFIRARVLRSYHRAARQLMVSLQPRAYGWLSRQLIRNMHPDLCATQGTAMSTELVSMGAPAIAIPSGVDMRLFSPVDAPMKARLCAKYGLDPNVGTVVHVGHLKLERNVLLLCRIREELGCQVVMVGSTSTVAENGIADELRKAGVTVIDSYLENVAELYQLANCYLFPVWVSGGAIEMPLSVLEALSCGTPVVSTPFGSLREWLPAGDGLTYAADDGGLISEVNEVLLRDHHPAPDLIRRQVEPLSWESIAASLLRALSIDLSPDHDNDALDQPADTRQADAVAVAGTFPRLEMRSWRGGPEMSDMPNFALVRRLPGRYSSSVGRESVAKVAGVASWPGAACKPLGPDGINVRYCRRPFQGFDSSCSG